MPVAGTVKPPRAVHNASNPGGGEARRRGRPKGLPDAAQRAALVAAAHRLFVTHGYGGTTMDALAAECRMSKRTLYRFFPGKAELFAAVVEAHRQSMLALPGDYGHLPLEEALAAIFRIDLTAEEDRARQALLRLVEVEGPLFPELQRILVNCGVERSRDALAQWLDAQQAAGRLALDDAAALARLLMDMVFGAPPPSVNGAVRGPAADERRAHIRRCIRVFLHGVAAG